MSRRARALAFLSAALACAGLAAALASGYGAQVSDQLGELRPVLVATAPLQAREPITPKIARRSLEVHRIPERFTPPGALTGAAEVIGREPAVAISAGAYLTGELLRSPTPTSERHPAIGRGLNPVEIKVAGAGALTAGGGAPDSVDVVVTTEPGPGESGRTYLAAEGVPLLGLREAPEEIGQTDASTQVATLAVTRDQALRLIDAESFARQVRLIPG